MRQVNGEEKKPSVTCGQRRSSFLKQPDQFAQFGFREMAEEYAVQLTHRLIQVSQSLDPTVGQGDIDYPAILLAAHSFDKPAALEPVDQARDAWDDRNGATGDFQNGERLSLAPQDAKDVVLRRSQPMLPQQPGKTNLKLVARPEEAQDRFLFQSLERLPFLELVL
jgi:hypothetical protein